MKRKRSPLNAAALFLCWALCILGASEIIFRFLPVSHGINQALSSRLWFKEYWKPVNRLGFRDFEIEENAAGKKKVIVLGDSFAAGHGIRSAEDRFSNILARSLGKDSRVFNLGVNGAGTLREIETLHAFPLKPDILILSYSPDDIKERALSLGVKFEGFAPYERLNPWLRFLVSRSYALNFVFWRLPHAEYGRYFSFLESAYANETVFNAHLGDLRHFIDYSRAQGVPFYAVIFPYFGASAQNQVYLGKIGDFFKGNGIATIEVARLTAGMPPEKLVVNRTDQHANELVNSIVADELFRRLTEDGRF
ncbi:MAG: SGNH/GDSL hydrolase family protein [Candidatus Omnitrophica bacterium]|nr:SGNH/GDSL hydrolase family protein [Candidatus Omnitrophota bacterium]